MIVTFSEGTKKVAANFLFVVYIVRLGRAPEGSIIFTEALDLKQASTI